MMKAGIAELKASLSEYLEKVRAGEEVLVTDRGRPVARLTRVEDLAADIEPLVRRGVLRPAAGSVDLVSLLEDDLPPDPERQLLEALLEERESGL
jgi:prevent-host-death family protein